MAVILTVGSPLPKTFASGTYPITTLNTGKYHFKWTPAAANTNAAWDSQFHALIVSGGATQGTDNGGIYIVNDAIQIYNQTGGGTLLISRAITWGAGAVIDITVDMAAGSITIAGATTGNGTFTFTPSGTVFSGGVLGIGQYGSSSSFPLPSSTVSNIDDTVSASAFAGTSAGVGAASASATVSRRLVAASAGTSTPSAAITIDSPGRLAGTSAGVSTCSATARVTRGLVATSAGVGAATAAIADPLPPLGIGIGTAAQRIDHITNGGPITLTTPSADVVVSSVDASTDIITATGAHGLLKGEGPFRWATTGTLPAPLQLGTDYWACDIGSTTFGAAATGPNAIANTQVNLTNAGSGTHTLVRTVNTQASGSMFVGIVERGAWDSAPGGGNPPTDNKSNTYTVSEGPHAYVSFAGSKTAAYASNGTGGANHTWTITCADEDEATVSIVEIIGGKVIRAKSHVERAIGSSTITSASVTITGPAMLLAACCGNGPVSQDHTFTPSAGWTKFPAASRETDLHPNGYIQITWAYRFETNPGTYTVSWSGVSNEGGQLYLFAITDGKVALAASSAGVGAATATARVARALAGSSTGLGAASASATVSRRLQAVSTGTGAGTAAATVFRSAAPSAAGVGTATATASVSRRLVASASGIGAGSATARVGRPLAGSSAGTSTALAAIDVEGQSEVDLSGSAAGTSTAAATARVARALVASAQGSSTALASLTVDHAGIVTLVGTSAGTSTSSARIVVARVLAGVSHGVSTATARLAGDDDDLLPPTDTSTVILTTFDSTRVESFDTIDHAIVLAA
jgi:hypothetical protein